jgi:hypothetical protein
VSFAREKLRIETMSRLLAGSSSRLILVGVQTKPAPPVRRYATVLSMNIAAADVHAV